MCADRKNIIYKNTQALKKVKDGISTLSKVQKPYRGSPKLVRQKTPGSIKKKTILLRTDKKKSSASIIKFNR